MNWILSVFGIFWLVLFFSLVHFYHLKMTSILIFLIPWCHAGLIPITATHTHTHTQRILISTPHIRTKVCVSLLLCLYSVSSERSMSICASFCHTANLAPGSGYKTTEQKQKHETASYSGLNCNFKQKTHWAVAQIDLWLLSLGSDTREEKRNG